MITTWLFEGMVLYDVWLVRLQSITLFRSSKLGPYIILQSISTTKSIVILNCLPKYKSDSADNSFHEQTSDCIKLMVVAATSWTVLLADMIGFW